MLFGNPSLHGTSDEGIVVKNLLYFLTVTWCLVAILSTTDGSYKNPLIFKTPHHSNYSRTAMKMRKPFIIDPQCILLKQRLLDGKISDAPCRPETQ